VAPVRACAGNGTIDKRPRTCDDGNFYSGDGCSSSCQLEAGLHLRGRPAKAVPVLRPRPLPFAMRANGVIEDGRGLRRRQTAQSGDGLLEHLPTRGRLEVPGCERSLCRREMR